MSERSASQAALDAFANGVEYYRDGLRRCAPDDEPRWRDRMNASQAVVDAIQAYESTLAHWRNVDAEKHKRSILQSRARYTAQFKR